MPHKDPEERRAYKRAWYRKNTKKVYGEVRARKKKLKHKFDLWREEQGCKRCGYNKYYGALELHHLAKSEEPSVAILVNHGYGWKKIMKEAEKCILLCANCHREVHKKN